MRRIASSKRGVVKFHEFRHRARRDLPGAARQHDAVLIATGVYKARDLEAPGVGLDGVVRAIDYLTASNRKGLGDEVPEFDDGTLNADGKNVVVIGGGDTAMDCVRTAVRQGAKAVKCLYRRDRPTCRARSARSANAEEEGVDFIWLTNPKGFDRRRPVTGVIAQRMRLGVARRQRPPDAPSRSRDPTTPKTPTWRSRRWASNRKTCRRCSANPRPHGCR
jgi:glutamate synthase (NADPH/NADH) small chain